MVFSVFGVLWWLVDCLQGCRMTMLALQHLPLFVSIGADSVQQYVTSAHVPAMCLRCVCLVLEAVLVWRGLLVVQHFSWFPSFPPLSWFRVSTPPPLLGFFHFTSTSVMGAIVGCWAQGLGGGTCCWVADWQACGCSSAVGCDYGCSPLTHGQPTSTCDMLNTLYYRCIILPQGLPRLETHFDKFSCPFRSKRFGYTTLYMAMFLEYSSSFGTEKANNRQLFENIIRR